MKKPEWPGIATAAALIFAGTIIFAIWRDPDGFKLKDWQTFIAACIALVGGVMAYRGAMAKVNLDATQIEQNAIRERTGVTLRLQSTLLVLRRTAKNSLEHIRAGLARNPHGMPLMGLGTVEGTDVEEAWNNLHLFPRHIAFKIANIRINLKGVDSVVERNKGSVIVAEHVRHIETMYERVDRYASEILEWTSADLKDSSA